VRRRHSRIALIGAVLTPLLLAFWLPAHAIDNQECYDEFTDSSFSGSDGPNAWASDWIEIGESDGAEEGAIQVNNDGRVCVSGDCLVLGHKLDANGKGAYRKVDLDRATSVLVTFGYRRHMHGTAPVRSSSRSPATVGRPGRSWIPIR